MTDRYQEWRNFYANKVRSWMNLEELRTECGKLTTTDAPSPEVLLIHAMHALEECAQRDEALLRQALEALKKVAQSLEWHAHGCCRGFDEGAPLPTNEAIELAKRTIAKVRA